MQTVTTIGLDIAKSVFQVHGASLDPNQAGWQLLEERQDTTTLQLAADDHLASSINASSHHWSRELQALGHTVRLMPPAYVKPYVKRQKNDATDAEAICEAVTRANMRFVPCVYRKLVCNIGGEGHRE